MHVFVKFFLRILCLALKSTDQKLKALKVSKFFLLLKKILRLINIRISFCMEKKKVFIKCQKLLLRVIPCKRFKKEKKMYQLLDFRSTQKWILLVLVLRCILLQTRGIINAVFVTSFQSLWFGWVDIYIGPVKALNLT